MSCKGFITYILVTVSSISQATPLVYTYDFIDNSSRTGFNGFEHAATSGWYYTGELPYVEGGVSVTQIADHPRSIWLTCGAAQAAGYCFGNTGHEGSYSWYPNGGDDGFTKITRSDGLDFGNVGFLTGNAYTTVGATYLRYVLRNDGAIVLAGQILIPQGSPDRGYLGFGGGGFDEIFVAEIPAAGGKNLLALDSIEMNSVPEPATAILLAIALLGMALRTQKPEQAPLLN